jgi:hypothetical protein
MIPTKEVDRKKKNWKRSQTHQRKRRLSQPKFHFQSLHSSTRRGKWRPTAESRSWEHVKTSYNPYNWRKKNISPLIEKIARQQYQIKALTYCQVEVQPKTSESYRTIIKALAEKHTEFQTYKLKKESRK